MKKSLVVSGTLLLRSACSEAESGPIPGDLDRSSSLAGVDSDSDGVRDDIARYIDAHYTEPRQRDALRQHAKALQRSLLVKEGDLTEGKRATIEISHAIRCIYTVFPRGEAGKESQKIESLVTNTKTRLLAHLGVSRTMDGTSWSLPQGDTCK